MSERESTMTDTTYDWWILGFCYAMAFLYAAVRVAVA